MNRRGFLGLLAKSAAAVAAGTVLPQILVAEEKIEPVRTWFIPNTVGKPSPFITSNMIVQETLKVLGNKLSMRMIRQYDFERGMMVTRMDALYGYRIVAPENSVLLFTQADDPNTFDSPEMKVVDPWIEEPS